MKIDKIKLTVAMIKKGYNVQQLAKAAGVSRTTISYIRSGKTASLDVSVKLALALGVDLKELLSENQSEAV